MNREQEIRLIAYSLWVQDNRRPFRSIENWLKAEAIWEANHRGHEERKLFARELEQEESILSGVHG
jgi:hypothetical protein